MIEDTDLGLKVAETKEESIFFKTKKACEERIKTYKEAMIIEEAILEMCEQKLQKQE